MASSSRAQAEDAGTTKGVSGVRDIPKCSSSQEGSSSAQRRPSKAGQSSKSTVASSLSSKKKRSEIVSVIPKVDIFEERAKRMGDRIGLQLGASDLILLSPDENVLRVEKPIRVRLRRLCHKCNTTFVSTNECAKCHHVTCEKCPRHLPRDTEVGLMDNVDSIEPASKAREDSPPIVADLLWGDQTVELRRPSRSGGQDLVHRKPRQRVRRTCHECQSLFDMGSRKCEQCNHIRCTDCPRDPPKKDKYPFGYPGDVFGPDTIPRFECRSCEALYPVDALDGTPCRRCGLEKSGASPRALPRKIEPAPEREILGRIQARLNSMRAAS